MCDFRPAPTKVIIKDTNEWKTLPYQGHFVHAGEVAKPEFGLYHLGATGCGYKFYDGQEWSDIDTTIPVIVWGEQRYIRLEAENEKYRFYREPVIQNYIFLNQQYGTGIQLEYP